MASSSSPPIVLVTITFFADADSPRLELALALVRDAVAAGLPTVVADDSPGTAVAEKFKDAGAFVVEEGGSAHGGGKGGAIRAALACAVEKFGKEGAVLYTEPEKVGLVRFANEICAPLLDRTAAVVVPRRTRDAFRRTYPIEQYHSESFGGLSLDIAAREAGLTGLPERLDWFFGPFACQRFHASKWLQFAATDWTAQIVPFVQLAEDGKKLAIVEVAYEHREAQKADEEGKGTWAKKRLVQLNAILPRLEQIFGEIRTGKDRAT